MKKFFLLFIIIIGIVFAWSPWLVADKAKNIIGQQFSWEYRKSNPKFSGPCTLNKVENLHRAPFAYKTRAYWKCADRSEENGDVYVTTFGITVGVPLE